jgi:CubicO group peptidase (beta-lactamase class C family)
VIDRLVLERLDDGVAVQPGSIPGAVVLVARGGEVVHLTARGDAVRYSSVAGEEASERVATSADTIFDLASLTKLFTAAVALKAVEAGALELDRPVAEYLPGFHDGVTLRHLLIHVSGLPAVRELWTVPGGREERSAALLASMTEAAPGVRHVYSCVGYLVAGLLLERVLGAPLPDLVAEHITKPLGMTDTGFCPDGSELARVAATEDSSHVGRGMIRGEVHDEASWSLGGTGGNAGVFGTAPDLLRFAEMLRQGGLDPESGDRVLAEESVQAMTTDHLDTDLRAAVGYGQGIGPRIADRTFMGSRVSDRAYGHTGFTGTSLVVDPDRELVVIVLANAVHPVRGRTMMGPLRSAIADAAAG